MILTGMKENVRTKFGKTLLHYAVSSNVFCPLDEIARLLPDSGADINSADNTNSTPLLEAKINSNDNLDGVKLLLANGFDIDAMHKQKALLQEVSNNSR